MKRLLFLALPGLLAAQLTVQLTPETGRAFDEYVKAVAPGLWESIGREEIQSREKGPREVPGGLIHDWTGAVLAPGARLEKALALLQDYDNYKKVYQPEVLDSRLIGRDRNHYRAYLKLKKKKVLTVVLNTEYEIDYQPDGPTRWRLASRSTRITEVSGERELEPGAGHGFLWRLNAYWLLEQRPEGLFLQCRAISLSRDVPAGLGWIIKPMVASLPRESLRNTLEATRRALR